MAATRSILALITDNAGGATKDFLLKTPEQWANEQMNQRYTQGVMPDDRVDSFPHFCFVHLLEEYAAMRAWFDDAGKLNPMLQSASLVNRLSGPIGDGIGWDWKQNGDPEHRMRMFKGMLIAVCRTAALIPFSDRNSGNMQFGGLATLIRSAYTERASIHRWNGIDGKGDTPAISGADLSRRWVAHMSYTFLINLMADRKWAWDVSKCKAIFGPIDEDRSQY